MDQPERQDPDPLLAAAIISERPFHSDVPLVGPLIAWLRTAWNGVSTKWYVRPLLQQQNAFNLSVARRLEFLESYLAEQTTARDRDLLRLGRETAAQQLRIADLQERLQALEEEVARLRAQLDGGGEGAG